MAGDKLAPPTLEVNTRPRALSQANTISSSTSNPFLTPVSPSIVSSSNASTIVVDPQASLQPDPGTEADFQVNNNPFAFSPGQLNKLFNPKSFAAFQALGGLRGIAHGLQSDTQTGLSIDEATASRHISFDEAVNSQISNKAEGSYPIHADGEPFQDRIRVYGQNTLPPKKATPLWRLIWAAYNDTVLIILTVAAAISLALGLYETFGAEHPPGSPTPVDWVEGLAICIAIIIVVLVTALNDWQKEQAFVRLNAKKEDREIKVMRSGKAIMINVHDVLAGDVVFLEPGDVIPVDGIFIDGHNVKCDESSATGESDAIRKTPGDVVMKCLETGQSTKGLDPFIISGARVLEGKWIFLVLAVGIYISLN
jgi:Ca2+-transporting ATPase